MKLQPKMLWILLSDSSEYKKAKVSMKMLLIHCYTDHEDALKNKKC